MMYDLIVSQRARRTDEIEEMKRNEKQKSFRMHGGKKNVNKFHHKKYAF